MKVVVPVSLPDLDCVISPKNKGAVMGNHILLYFYNLKKMLTV